MRHSMSRSRVAIGSALAVVFAMTVGMGVVAATPSGGPATVDVQLLAINDFHGNLEPPSGSCGRIGTINAGGVEYLATHVAEPARRRTRTRVVVSAGDLIGASPLLSALFHDEPTIEAINLIGPRLQRGRQPRVRRGRRTSCCACRTAAATRSTAATTATTSPGADFRFLAANVVREDNGKTLFPAYKIRSFAGAKVAFIGMTLEGTPTIVTPVRRRRPRLPGRGRDGQRADAGAEGEGCRERSSC